MVIALQSPRLQVVGIGLDGPAGLTPLALAVIEQADILVGGQRHLDYFPVHGAQKWPWGELDTTLAQLSQWLSEAASTPSSPRRIVVLASGDPLFFGIGRLLLTVIPADQIEFYPHVSSVQLAFSRLKQPWQDAHLVSIHGRDPQPLIQKLRQGAGKIAVIGDPNYRPLALAKLVLDQGLGSQYRLWLCENLGSPQEQLRSFWPEEITATLVADPLHLWVLLRQPRPLPVPSARPLLGIPDAWFDRFPDRPGLMTKGAVRTLILGELFLTPDIEVVWDVGAGTGSVSVELAQVLPQAQVYGIEKTAMGQQLIHSNCKRFGVGEQVTVVAGSAPEALGPLPDPDRVFVGGSGGHLLPIVTAAASRLRPQGRLVVAIATLENLSSLLGWLELQSGWCHDVLQINVARSTAIATHTRLSPLNPVTLITIMRQE